MKKTFTSKDKSLIIKQIAEILGIDVNDIQKATVSHTDDTSDILNVGNVYEYSTYEITIK